ncbi:MAG: prepilin-type N-terminal cleavage/methylation domain-containing protein [Pseudomonadota bacterium]|nr:prepilin-type N-terminal cleavage/methylation domain-containing protein [Pseudomonadota bacterium]
MKNQTTKAFTLIELLAAVAIVGVLVTLAVPRYNAFVARSRQGEAKLNLGTIANLQEAFFTYKLGVTGTGSYYSNANEYAGNTDNCTGTDAVVTNALGFRLSDCSKARYAYNFSGASSNADGGENADTSYQTLYPSCNDAENKERDTWTITSPGKVLTHNTDVVAACRQ